MGESFIVTPASTEMNMNHKKERHRGTTTKDNFRHLEMCIYEKKMRT